VTLDDFRNDLPPDIRPSWVKLTTITMISSFKKSIDIEKLKRCFQKLAPIKLKLRNATKKSSAVEWLIKPTKFYNQITLCYTDDFSQKSIKLFPNGSIQVAGCSDLINCKHIIKQLSYLLKIMLGSDFEIPLDTFRVVMINSNFSLNWNINLIETCDHFEKYSDVFKVSFEPDRYSAVKIKFKPAEDMKEITVSIFGTGKIIITGAETLKEIAFAYNIINQHINTNDSIRISRVSSDKMDVFDIASGRDVKSTVEEAKKIGIKSWKNTIKNIEIYF
tara:strand:- start:3859 stop:4686 length:828 start_codon:yes stop_codon:yes gene_type:complete